MVALLRGRQSPKCDSYGQTGGRGNGGKKVKGPARKRGTKIKYRGKICAGNFTFRESPLSYLVSKPHLHIAVFFNHARQTYFQA